MRLTIPYYLHKAGAGFPSPATDYIEEDIDLNIHLIKNVPATFIIRVQGKSMTNIGINDGDLLVVDKSLNPKNFSTVIENVYDDIKLFLGVCKQNFDFSLLLKNPIIPLDKKVSVLETIFSKIIHPLTLKSVSYTHLTQPTKA